MKRMDMNGLRGIFFLFFFILTSFVFSQQPDLEFHTLGSLENITNSKATSITQDSTGFLWIGTTEGLFRFDGQSVYPYFHSENDSTSIPANKIYKLFVDRKKNVWICTSDGLCLYNPEYDNFTAVVTKSDLKGVPGTDIYVINEDKTGQLYIAFEKSIFKFDTAQNLFLKVLELPQGKINAIVFDNLNNIWIGASSDGGISYFDQQSKQLDSFRNNPKNRQSLSNDEVLDIALIKNKLWIATYGGGIDCYNLKDKTFKNYFSPNYFENYGFSLFVDQKNNLWVCTLGSLKFYDQNSDIFFNYYYQANNPKSLGKSLIRFYQDKQGNYWTIHSPGGIKYSETGNRIQHFSNNTEGFWNTSEKNITTISTDASGNLWIGNYYNGVDVFNWQKHQIDRYQHKENDLKSLGNGTIFSIFRDSKNQMWIGSYLGGLQKFNPETKNFESYLNKPKDTLSIAGNDVRSISEDGKGYLWVAVQGKGIDHFDPKTKTFRHYNARNNHLSNDYTFQVFNDSKGNLWVASAYGLNLLPKGGLLFKSFVYSKNDSTSINSNIIQVVYEDQQQNIWIGTPEGLNKYNPKSQSFTRYLSHLKNKNVCSILSDTKNNIWVSTNAGISKFNPITKKVTNFDQTDGLLSREFFPLASYTNDHKNLFFGGSEGIDSFNPDSLNIDFTSPTVFLTDFKLFNKSISYKTESKIIDKFIGYAERIILDHNSNSIAISYQTIKLIKPEKINYAYKLDGFDRDWNYVGTKKEANYNNLDPGKYTFLVKARYDNGDWSKKITSIQIHIVPPWWMTTWFRIIAGIVLLIAPFVFIHLRTSRLINQRKKLEAIVAERTKEIQEKNEQLHKLNSTKDKLFSIISHDLRSPFNAILGFQDLLIGEYYNLSDAERLDMLNQVQSASRQMYGLVENLLSWARIQSNNIQNLPVKFDLKTITLEIVDLYQKIADTKGITLFHNIQEGISAYADINLMKTALRNLMDNAIKFTAEGGSIRLSARQQTDFIELSVSDSGTGMTKDQVENLFNLEKTKSRRGTNGEMGSGLGLILCKELVEMNHGKITVESRPHKGSTFSFTIPASKK